MSYLSINVNCPWCEVKKTVFYKIKGGINEFQCEPCHKWMIVELKSDALWVNKHHPGVPESINEYFQNQMNKCSRQRGNENIKNIYENRNAIVLDILKDAHLSGHHPKHLVSLACNAELLWVLQKEIKPGGFDVDQSYIFDYSMVKR